MAAIDVSIEHKTSRPSRRRKRHPNTCPSCGSHYRDEELEASPPRLPAVRPPLPDARAGARIEHLADPGSFEEEAAELRSADPLEFFDLRPYRERLAEAELVDRARRRDGHRAGDASTGSRCELSVMDFSFMGGSMGSVVGEKFARACDSAAERGVPLVSVTASGGARMQEGILSLMQLPKTVCAVEDLHDAGQRADQRDGASDDRRRARELRVASATSTSPSRARCISFTGPRVVQQTTREKLPDDFGLAESNYRFGHVDAIVPRAELRPTLARLLRLFAMAA